MILFFASVEIILLAKKALEKGWKDVGAGMEGRDGCPVPLQTQPASSRSGAEDILSTVPFQPTNHSPAKCTLVFFSETWETTSIYVHFCLCMHLFQLFCWSSHGIWGSALLSAPSCSFQKMCSVLHEPAAALMETAQHCFKIYNGISDVF